METTTKTNYVIDGRGWLVQSPDMPGGPVEVPLPLPEGLRDLDPRDCHDVDVSGCR
jgi:hypothetical protein